MKKGSVLYIGNDFAKKSNYQSTMETLSSLLTAEGYDIVKSSNKKNQFFRLIAMCFAVIKHRKIAYVLIDTFSTSAFYYALLTSQISRLFGKKYIPILHGGNLPSRLKKSPYLSNLIFKNSFKNIAPSNYLKTAFEKEGFKVVYIPNTIEIENYKFKERKQFEPKLLWVRAFADIYNPSLAVEVVRVLKEDYPQIQLCMVGPVKDDSFLIVNQLIKDYNLEENIEITGVLPKEEWHKKSTKFDVFINTTNVDNTPVSVIEAMALGLPVVTTNVAGIPYLIKNKIDGVLVDKNNPQQMAEAIKNIIENPDVNLAINARKKAENFAWKEVRKKWLETLK